MEILNILRYPFKRNYTKHEGVMNINIFLLRLLFLLMFFFLSYDSWSHILTHTGSWKNSDAAAWCMWGSYSIISFIGVIRPLKMLPIVIFEIIYKTTWLLIVACPLWQRGELAGSSAEGMTHVFLGVTLFIIAMPWSYFFKTYIFRIKSNKRREIECNL